VTHRRMARPCLLAAGFAWLAGSLAGAVEMPTALEAGPFLTGLRPDRITISWQTKEPTTGRVECRFGRQRRLADSPAPARLHQVTLAGLPPATECSYRLFVGHAATPFWRFRTAPDGPAPVRFAVYGDSRSNPEKHARVAQAIAAHDPAFVVHTGDFVSDGRVRAQWVAQFFVPAAELLRGCPILPAMGTHEKHSPVFYDYFAPPRELLWAERLRGAPPAAFPTAGWTAWRFGSLDFLVLNSYASVKPGDPQLVWLEQALAECRGTWRIVVAHEPFFSSGKHGGSEKLREALLPLLLERGVDLVFAGHDHTYERTVPFADGDDSSAPPLVQIVTGGGGASLYKVQPGPWAAHASSTLNFCIVGVEDDALVVSAYDDASRPLDCAVLTKANGRRDFGEAVPVAALEFLAAAKRFKSFSFPHPGAEPKSKEFSFSAANPYAHEMVGELSWEDAEGNGWALEPPSQTVRVAPRGKATVRFTARFDPTAAGAALAAAPQAVLRAAGRSVAVPAFAIEAPPRPRKPEPPPPPPEPTDPFDLEEEEEE